MPHSKNLPIQHCSVPVITSPGMADSLNRKLECAGDAETVVIFRKKIIKYYLCCWCFVHSVVVIVF
jgi:hypothetical protein